MTVWVNDTPIDELTIAREVQNHPAQSLEQAREIAVRALVVRELLLQEANRRGLGSRHGKAKGDCAPEQDEGTEDALIDALLDEAIEVPVPDLEACRRYYQRNKRRFRSPDLFEAAHILFVAHRDDESARAEAEALARKTLAEIQTAPERFAELARERSACSSSIDGGRLGQVARGDTVPEFETFLYGLEQGQVCPLPIETRYGFHLLRLDRRIEGRQIPFEVVQHRVADYLQEQSWRRGLRQFVQILAGQARIDGAILEAAASPLVQ